MLSKNLKVILIHIIFYFFSDWIEECSLKVTVRPILISVSTGLLHRIAVVRKAFEEVPAVEEIGKFNDTPKEIITHNLHNNTQVQDFFYKFLDRLGRG